MTAHDDKFAAKVLRDDYYRPQLERAREGIIKSSVWRGVGSGALIASVLWFGVHGTDEIDISHQEASRFQIDILWKEDLDIALYGAAILAVAGITAKVNSAQIEVHNKEAKEVRERAQAYGGDPVRAIDIALKTENTKNS